MLNGHQLLAGISGEQHVVAVYRLDDVEMESRPRTRERQSSEVIGVVVAGC